MLIRRTVWCGAAFAALKTDGSVVTWGNALYGGNSEEVKDHLVQVVAVVAAYRVFSAVKEHIVVSWGMQWRQEVHLADEI